MTKAGEPLPVSVVIPMYNRAHTIGRAIESILRQHPTPPDEVIVVDDGSTDDGAAVAGGYGVRVLRHTQNRGLSQARNSGLAVANNDWVAFLDSDDEWLPQHLTNLWRRREGHVLVGAAAIRSGEGASNGRIMGPPLGADTVLRSPRDVLYPANPLAPSAAMVRRDVALGLGGFRPWDGVIEDLDLWVRLLVANTGLVARDVGVRYHVHDDQMSGDVRTMRKAVEAALDDYVERGWCSARTRRLRLGVLAWDAFRWASGRRAGAGAYAELRALAHPVQCAGAMGALAARVVNRRESARWSPDGRPIAARVPGSSAAAAGGGGALPPVIVDLSGDSTAAVTWRLLRRPTRYVLAPSRGWRILLGTLKIDPLERDA